MNSVTGLAVLITAAVPGFVYAWLVEKWGPRHTRSGLLLAGELAFVGVITSLASALVTFSIGRVFDWINPTELIDDPQHYLADHPERALSWVLATLLCSYSLAALLALISFWGRKRADVRPGSVWDHVLEPGRGTKVAVSIELLDGRRFVGFAATHDVGGARDSRDLALQYPIASEDVTTGNRALLNLHRMVFPAEEINWFGVVYQPPPTGLPDISISPLS